MCFLTAVLDTGRLTFMVLAGGITRYGMDVRLSFSEEALSFPQLFIP
jgi:TRAP-type C4-dicarboxylate transport system permease small subunit